VDVSNTLTGIAAAEFKSRAKFDHNANRRPSGLSVPLADARHCPPTTVRRGRPVAASRTWNSAKWPNLPNFSEKFEEIHRSPAVISS